MPESPRIAELRRRLDKDPASIAFAQLAEEHRRGGDHEQAVRICRDGLARHPGYLSAQVTLGRALMELGFYEEARKELESVLKVASDNLAAIRALAVIHQRRRHVSTPDTTQEPETPAEPPSAAPLIEAPSPAAAPLVESAGAEFAGNATELMVPDADELIVPDAEELIVPEAAAPVVDAPTLPDLNDWNLDVDLAIDLPGDPVEPVPPPLLETGGPELQLDIDIPNDVLAATPPELLQQRDPALEHLEQWLAAIISDRHQSG